MSQSQECGGHTRMWALAWLLKGIAQHHHRSLHLCAEGMEDSVKTQYAFFILDFVPSHQINLNYEKL